MFLEILFLISGIALGIIIGAKVWEDRSKSKPAILRLISRGDEKARLYSHEIAHRYFEFKDSTDFFVSKELPFKTRNFIQKANITLKERVEKHLGDIRGSKFLKRSDGLNEFFKSLSEKENGGRIDEILETESEEKQD